MILLLDNEMREELRRAYDQGVTNALYGDVYDIGARDAYVEPAIDRIKSTSVVIDVQLTKAQRHKG